MNQRVPILVYHHVYPDDDPGTTPISFERATGIIGKSEFRRQLAYIAEHGWEVVSTSRVVDWLDGAATLPRRAVALHFDNGWLDTTTVALPALQEYGFTGTSYVITGGTSAASGGEAATVRTSTEGAISKPFLTWDHVRGLLDAGWEIGAHTVTHPRLGEVQEKDGDGNVLKEVEESNRTFAGQLGFVPAHFAYPSGSRNERTDELLSGLYRSLRLWGFGYPARWGFTDRHSSPMALDCQNVDSTVSFEDFVRIFAEAEGLGLGRGLPA